MTPPPTPELERLKACRDKIDLVEEFIDYLRENGHIIAEVVGNWDLDASLVSDQKWIYRFLGLDSRKLDEERFALLQYQRSLNEGTEGAKGGQPPPGDFAPQGRRGTPSLAWVAMWGAGGPSWVSWTSKVSLPTPPAVSAVSAWATLLGQIAMCLLAAAFLSACVAYLFDVWYGRAAEREERRAREEREAAGRKWGVAIVQSAYWWSEDDSAYAAVRAVGEELRDTGDYRVDKARETWRNAMKEGKGPKGGGRNG